MAQAAAQADEDEEIAAEPIVDEPDQEIVNEQAPVEEAIAEPQSSEPIPEQVETPASVPESPPAVVPDVTEDPLEEVDEPVQVATEAFTVQPKEADFDQVI